MKPGLLDNDGRKTGEVFQQLKSDRELRVLHGPLEEMWERYQPYADRDFREKFPNDVDAHFWEMYLGCKLLDAGHELLPWKDRPREGGQPDLCVIDDDRRVWIEAIAPEISQSSSSCGKGIHHAPLRSKEVLLTISGALWNKAEKMRK